MLTVSGYCYGVLTSRGRTACWGELVVVVVELG